MSRFVQFDEYGSPENLKVVTGALVTGLILEGGRAAGVSYRCQGRDEEEGDLDVDCEGLVELRFRA